MEEARALRLGVALGMLSFPVNLADDAVKCCAGPSWSLLE